MFIVRGPGGACSENTRPNSLVHILCRQKLFELVLGVEDSRPHGWQQAPHHPGYLFAGAASAIRQLENLLMEW